MRRWRRIGSEDPCFVDQHIVTERFVSVKFPSMGLLTCSIFKESRTAAGATCRTIPRGTQRRILNGQLK